ncbi:MAG: ABC transporter substrate-binding protein [Anaerolineae bacterium]|nr:ABC transporter substrate-binding protein [Anaerolineae bacterium]
MKHRAAFVFVLVMMLLASTAPISAQQYGESPMLAKLVADGKLPAVAERLPSSPRVIKFPGSDVGTYGGDFRDPFVGDAYWASQMVFWTAWRGLVSWNETYTDWVPNIAEKVDVNPEATEYTFHLRQGLKWSDGVAFTSDDVLFYFEDILGNSELNGGHFPDGWLKPGKDAPVVKKIDDATFTITFDVPYGMFLLNMCSWPGWELSAAPKHYLQQFHVKYNPDGIKDLIPKTEGATDWVTLFQAHSAVGTGSDASIVSRDTAYPTMFPWIYTQPMGTGTQFIAERNPYYYWVDANGNQLPYIDRIVGTAYQDEQTMLVDVLAGKFDTMANTTDKQRPLFFQNEATSGLKVYPNKSEGGGTVSIMFNETDPTLGKIFSQKDFRIGMSYAINRQEVIDIVYFGQGAPRQVSPIEDSPLYNKQLSSQYIEYDVDKANASLDKVLPDKDADGFRLDPATGKRLSVVFTVQTGDYGLRFGDVAELLKKYYAKVGVEIVIDTVSNEVWTQRVNENGMEATIFTGEGGYGITSIIDPRYFVPIHGQSVWGNAWQLWYLQPNNKAAVEPPQLIKDQVALYKQVLQAPTSEQRLKLMSQVLQTAADEFWVIGISSASDAYRPLSTKLANVPESWVGGWNPGGPAIAQPEQWYFKG